MRILVLSKRQYMNKDLIDDRFGRFREIPLSLAQKGHNVQGLCLSYSYKTDRLVHDGPVSWQSINATRLMLPGLLRFIIRAIQYANRSAVIWACSDSIYGIIGYMLSKIYHIPLAFDLYDNFDNYLMARFPVIKQLYHYAVRNCDAVTCVSRPLARLVKSYGGKNQPIILENAVSGMETHAIEITFPNPGFPTVLASCSLKTIIIPQINKDMAKLDKNATLVVLYLSSSFSNSC